jgi:motility quorum-sensing regulator / GCU-specific mRNA interferase toxin
MEKSSPHCKLSVVKALIETSKVKATTSAFAGARVMGITDLAGMCAVVMSLTSDNFYKSMTTHAHHPRNGSYPKESASKRSIVVG